MNNGQSNNNLPWSPIFIGPSTQSQKQLQQQQQSNNNQNGFMHIPSPATTEQILKLFEESKENEYVATLKQVRGYKCKSQINKDGSVTFWPTPGCKPSTTKLKGAKPILSMQFLEDMKCKEAVCCSDPDVKVIQESKICSFLEAALTAWSNHYPFRFKPDHIWLLILQGIAVHVDRNAEKLREKYVSHDGKMKLEVGVSHNISRKEWMEIIQNFAAQIDKNTIKDTCELLECDFSTSTMTERLAAKVTIMDICKQYFINAMMTLCGFPQITLDGTKNDWIKLKQKATKLLNEKVTKKFGEEWKKSLLPLLDRFIGAFDGEIDCLFWNSMVKRGHVVGSGGYSMFHGWINILFPYMGSNYMGHQLLANKFKEPYSDDLSYVKQGLMLDANVPRQCGTGRDVSGYPTGLASAPVILDDVVKMKFLAGFIGYKQDEKTLEITPNVAWCIANSMTHEKIKGKGSK